MRRPRRIVPLLAALLLGGCVDLTPLDYQPPAHHDAGAPSADGGLDPARLACKECVTLPGAPCRDAYEACTKNPRCVEFTDCLFELGCFSPVALNDRIACGDPCFKRVGILSGTDPALSDALPINGCTQGDNPCGSVCSPP